MPPAGEDWTTTAGQDGRSLAERTADALDLQVTGAGVLQTLGAVTAQTTLTEAVEVHRHAHSQAQRAGLAAQQVLDVLRTSRATAPPDASVGRATVAIERAARAVTDAGQATALASQIAHLVRHAADITDAFEVELLATALAVRELGRTPP